MVIKVFLKKESTDNRIFFEKNASYKLVYTKSTHRTSCAQRWKGLGGGGVGHRNPRAESLITLNSSKKH